MVPPPPPDNDKDDVLSPYQSGSPARTVDNEDNDVTLVDGVDVITKNGNNADNTSTNPDDNVAIILFSGEKDGDATTGDVAGVSHAKKTKVASKSGFGYAAKGGYAGIREVRRAVG